jgi:ATP-dependent exoDNAse (exonuclease V) beta subunit
MSATPAEPLADHDARARITAEVEATLFVEAGAGSGKTRSLVERVVALVAHGVEMRHIAAITFTDKAAAELRDRVRQAVTARCDDPDPAVAARMARAGEQLDAAAVCTLHAFAHRILAEHPIEAGLPPHVAVLDEVASQIEFDERWRQFRDELLERRDLERTLLLAFAAGVRLDDLRSLAVAFEGNWDRLTDGRLPWAELDPPSADVAGLLEEMDAVVARSDECADPDDKLCRYLREEVAPYAERLRQAGDEYEQLRLLLADKPTFAGGRGRKANWDDKASISQAVTALGEAKRDAAGNVAEQCVKRLAVEVARFSLATVEQRRANGRLEFHDLLVMARELLRGPRGPAVRGQLGQRYQRLLLDEFQDTDPIQIELATLIASHDPHAGERPWRDIPVEPGRLFVVGDPKQSIYRFRRADMALFLAARETVGQPLALTTNFRSAPGIIRWVNAVFGRLIRHEADSQPAYQPLEVSPHRGDPPVGAPVAVLGASAHADEPDAEALRQREADDVAEAVRTALGWQVSDPGADGGGWRPATRADVTVLVPARTSLAALERALDARDIPYRAETSSLVYTTREVRDLMAAARAVVDPTDELALVTALRSPVFGCGDDDLFTYRVIHRGAWRIGAAAPDGLDHNHPVVAALAYLGELHQRLAWLAPSELLETIARDRRLFELGYAGGRPRDLWRRLRFVIDQARAWSESEGGTPRQYLEWARLQASDSTRVAETVLPETDDDSVRIMTIHGSKGLEFPITILSGMTTASRGVTARVEVGFPDQGPVAIKVGQNLTTPEFAAFKPVNEQMGFHERLRLLYVACTRAQDHLVVSLHRAQRTPPADAPHTHTNAELIAGACDDLDALALQPVAVTPDAAATAPAPGPLPDVAAWQRERDAALAHSSRRASLGASELAGLMATGELDGETRAGVDKAPRDLELPAWQKGRYGTAVGRAVHAVLQTVDLATGDGLTATVAAQAAAEGVVDRERDIAGLAGAALGSATVRRALAHPRWRETYVAARVGPRTLEGYIDLLYRSEQGLVIVDYKTTSSTVDLDQRLAVYRWQGGAYALAVEEAVGEPVATVVFVFLTPQGAVDRELADLPAAKAEVVQALETVGGA